ncbi:signal peptidase I [Janibacter hoylei]|uniref:signal peptidase I n=1 Tax=Janibacter hoylei TaxID=364298 RepID=UPI0022387251|nr:signal peptidase I [Janibacter hoylei]MCW4602707.1 signal peptidase I [Janibacter hoylei]
MSTEPAQDANASTPAGDPAGVDVRPARRLLLEIGVAVLLVMLLRIFVMESFHVPSGSMASTIQPGDRVVVTKIGASHVERGDVIVFDGTTTFAAGDRTPFASDGLIGRTLSSIASTLSIDLGEQDFLKRVAGVGGDRVSCTPKGGLVVNGSPVDEPWLAPGTTACDTPFDVKVPQGRLFVLGDNRSDSADSRSHLGDPGGGMVPIDDVVGHVSWRYWPIDRIGGLGH